MLVGKWWSYRARSSDLNSKVKHRVDQTSVFIGALQIDLNEFSINVWTSARENVLIDVFIRDLLLYSEVVKLVVVRIRVVDNPRIGARVVLEWLELVGDRIWAIEKHAVRVSITEFYYDDIAGSAVIVVIIPISVASSVASSVAASVAASVASLVLGEDRVSDEGWKGGEGGGFEVVHHFS